MAVAAESSVPDVGGRGGEARCGGGSSAAGAFADPHSGEVKGPFENDAQVHGEVTRAGVG